MAIPITIPRLGWSMDEGTFLGWLKQHGEPIQPGDSLFTLEGEKAAEDVECLDAGTLHIPPDGPKPGDRVAVGKLIGHLLQPGEATPSPSGTLEQPRPSLAPAASPSVRRLARERGIDLVQIAGSGSGGRIVSEDLGRAAKRTPHIESPQEASPPKASSPRARRAAAERGINWREVNGTGRNGRVRERDIPVSPGGATTSDAATPLSPIRRTIAERMVASCRANAPVTLFATVDATNLVNLRGQFKTASQATGDPVPSYTDMLVKLTAGALLAHPRLNSCWMDGGIVVYSGINVGIAVDVEAGLVVPVVRDVPALSLKQVVACSADLIARARTRALTAKEMQGGTFTITSLGSFGVDSFTPIINADQCAILGVGRIARRPAVRGKKLVAREQMTLSLTFDHRVVDGAPAARFLQVIADRLEAPGPWLMS